MGLILFSIAGAALYRMGGTYLGTKYRDWGVPTCMIWWFILNGIEHWSLVVCWLLMFGAQTTYFKKEGTDATWKNWILVGLAFSLALLPYCIFGGGSFHGFLLRSVAVTVFVCAWSELIGTAWIEESGRGFIQIITLPILL